MASSGRSSTPDGQEAALGHHRFHQMQRKSAQWSEKKRTIKDNHFFCWFESFILIKELLRSMY